MARSGIRTRAGYRKFDSQRVKDIESEDDDGGKPVDEGVEDTGTSSDEDDALEPEPVVKSYNALLQAFNPSKAQDGRRRKRRKLEERETPIEADSDGEGEESDHVEVTAESSGDESNEVQATNGEVEDTGDEEDENFLDAFETHFANPDENDLKRRLEAVQAKSWRAEKQSLPSLGAIVVSAPGSVQGSLTRTASASLEQDLMLKRRLQTSVLKYIRPLDRTQQVAAPYLSNYADVLLGNRTPQNAKGMRELACLHAINHVLKGRDKVLKNNARLSHSEEDLDVRDQGFTRPKVLILLETRQACVQYANTIVDLFDPEQQENKQRFQDSFSVPVDQDSTMPADYRELFEGNNDNNFLIGLKFTRKTMKFYSPFYTSDIILASPLGLRRILENEDVKKRDHDFLSSIEVAIVDQADAMQMQNWENVEVVFNHLNLQLKEAHGCDFSRVRNWYLDGNAKYLRQTILFSAYITPEMNRLFDISMLNVTGKAKLTPTYSEGALANISGLGIKQTFSRFDATSPATDPDARFKYFTTALLPSLLRLPKPVDGAQGLLVFIPSYYDFLRLRNFFATSTLTANTSFGAIHDYTDVSSQRRARSHFLTGRHSVLLYTQRAHHFFRLRLKGVKRVVMYGLPDNPIFYEELVGGFLSTTVQDGKATMEEVGVRAMFSKWDGLRMERVVGSERVKGMLGGVGDTFDFV